MRKKLLSLMLLVFCGIMAMAQDVELKLSAPQKVSTGQMISIELSTNAGNMNITKAELSPFNVAGRSQSFSSSTINGVTSIKNSVIFRAYCNTPGKYTIKPFEAEIQGKTYKSNSITVEVSGEPAAEQTGAGSGSHYAQTQTQTPPPSDDITFIDVTCNKSEVYVGEPVIMTAYLYSRYNIAEFGQFDQPKFEGFWCKDIENPTNISLDRKRFNNVEYIYAMLQKKSLTPQKAGTLTIDPYELEVLVSRGFFNTGIAKARSKAKTIKVKPLPADGKPADFAGAVGSFKITMDADRSEVNLDEPLTIKVSITGSGNFQTFNSPKLEMPSAFEQYPPKNEDGENSKKSKTVVIARQPGEYVIPGIKLSYFDPQSKSYKTIQAQDISIKVKGERSAESSSPARVIGTDIEDLGTDIRFIKQDGIRLKNGKQQFFNSFNFWLIFILIPLIMAGILVWRLQQIKNEANVTDMKHRKAGKTSRKRLKKAERFISENKKNEFYVELLNALWGYLGDKLSIPVSELNRDNVQEKLAQKGIEPATTEKYINALDTCEFEHYAPESLSKPLSDVYTMAAEAIEEMETSIK